MKKFILIFSMLLISIISISQTTRFESDYIALKQYENNNWSEWSDWIALSPTVSIVVSDNYTSIASAEAQFFTYKSNIEPFYNKRGDYYVGSRCVDIKGIYCDLYIVKMKDGTAQLTIYYDYLAYSYNLTLSKTNYY